MHDLKTCCQPQLLCCSQLWMYLRGAFGAEDLDDEYKLADINDIYTQRNDIGWLRGHGKKTRETFSEQTFASEGMPQRM